MKTERHDRERPRSMSRSSDPVFLDKLADFGIKLGLDKTLFLLSKFGNPHHRFPSVLIAGTNGKGSVAKTLATILKEAGIPCGLYTSPHLVDVRERISFNGRPIGRKEFAGEIGRLRRVVKTLPVDRCPTYFEALTIIAFSWFAKKNAALVVAEIGMGGRFDATNTLSSFCEVITAIGYDHQQYLGATLTKIAREKAGIIKKGSPVICAAQKKEALAVIRAAAATKKARLILYGRDFTGRKTGDSDRGQEIAFSGPEDILVTTPLLGRHQVENVSLAVRAALEARKKGFSIPDEAIRSGVAATVWPARFQLLRTDPPVILDGAHNPPGSEALKKTLRDRYPGEKFSLLVGMLKDKDYRTMVASLLPAAREIVFTLPVTERAVHPGLLAGIVKASGG